MSQAIFVRPDSPIVHPGGLIHTQVAVNFHSSSHYQTLRLLEGYLTREQIKLVHLGSPRSRYIALMEGRCAAATLQEPFITMAEKVGCRLLCEGFFLSSDIGSETMEESVYEGITVAMRKAVKLINDDKRRFLHHILADPELQDMPDQPEYPKLTVDDFNLSRLRYIDPQPYPQELFENTYNWMQSWNLVNPGADWDRVADNRGPGAEVPVGR